MRFSHANIRFGAWLWALCIQYFIVQAIVISAWTVPHSFANNFISDLGNTECGAYAGQAVCSPLHPLMNASFILFGVSMSIGAILLMRQFRRSKLTNVAFGMMVIAGIGTVMVGLFPENTIGVLHQIGAIASLGIGNVSVLLLGIGLREVSPRMRAYTIISGCVSLTAFTLFALGIYGFLGRGGMERLISYPFSVWMIIFGVYMLTKLHRPTS